MTPNRRIFLNIVATYGRSLYALVIGLFCGWRTLMARWFDGGGNGKIHGKGMSMSAARLKSRRFGWATGKRECLSF